MNVSAQAALEWFKTTYEARSVGVNTDYPDWRMSIPATNPSTNGYWDVIIKADRRKLVLEIGGK